MDSFILIQKRYERRIVEAKDYLVEIAQQRELPLAQIQPLNKPLLEMMAHFLKLQSDFPEKPDKELNDKLKEMAKIGDFYGVFILKITDDKRYIVTASSDSNFVGKDYTNFFNLHDIIDREMSSYISYNSKTLEPYFIVAHLIFSPEQEKVIGLLAISDDITYKHKELLVLDDHRYPVSFALLLPSTVVFAATDPEMRFHYFLDLQPEQRQLFIEEELFPGKLLPDEPIKVEEGIGKPFFEFTWQGEEQIGYVKKLPDNNFTLLTYAAKDKIFHSPILNFFNIYSIYGLILIIGGTVAYLLIRRMAKPIQDLSVVMQKIQQGEIHLRYKIDPLGFEINALGTIFNEMVDAVLEQKKVAEEERLKREILARELILGQQAQRSLLPQKMPQYPGVELAELYIPAIEVGGDFYDVFVKTRTDTSPQLFIAVADASGKGVQACFYSLSVRNMLRTYAKEYDDVGMAMSATNNLFTLDTGETGMFVTVFMGAYDYDTQTFKYFSSGHNPGIVRREDGSIEILQHHGIAMGVLQTGDQHEASIQLNKGDTVILYTDGVTEAHNEEYQHYGEERLAQLIQSEGWRSASELVEQIAKQVDHFVGQTPQHDDITLLIMKII